MNAFVLIFCCLMFLLTLICVAFVWAVNNKQYQDLDTESRRILEEGRNDFNETNQELKSSDSNNLKFRGK